MSFDLGVFYTEKPHSDDDAGERYVAYCQEDNLSPWVEHSPKVAAFLKELTAQYPDINESPEQNVDESPWAADFDVSEGHVLMPMAFSWAERMYPVIVGLAEKHGLVCFDPQEGRIVTAPFGIHMEETEQPPVVVPDDPKNPAKPLADTLKDMLKPLGFERKGRYWRKDAEKAVIALESYNDDGIYSIEIYAWFKALGEIEASKVKHGGQHHLYRRLDSDFIPERSTFRLLRAFHFGRDYVDSLPRLYGPEIAQQLMAHYVPNEPLTPAWRASELRQVMEDYVLPFFARIEASEHKAIFAEEGTKRDKERLELNEATLKKLRQSVAMCRKWIGGGLDQGELIARARKEIGSTFLVALALSLAFGWTLAETEKMMAENGIQWTNMTRQMLETEFEEQESLKLLSDGHTELLPE